MLLCFGLRECCGMWSCCAAQAHFFLGQALLELGEAELLSAIPHLSKARPRPTQLLSCQSRTAAHCASSA